MLFTEAFQYFTIRINYKHKLALVYQNVKRSTKMAELQYTMFLFHVLFQVLFLMNCSCSEQTNFTLKVFFAVNFQLFLASGCEITWNTIVPLLVTLIFKAVFSNYVSKVCSSSSLVSLLSVSFCSGTLTIALSISAFETRF